VISNTFRLDIVEPTLASEAGHCGLLLRSLHEAAPGLHCTVWAGRGAGNLFSDLDRVEIRPHFSRRWRKLQAFLLYRRLLRTGATLLVPTAGRFDLEALARAAPAQLAPNRAFLYFHRLVLDTAKASALRRIAAAQPNLVVLGTCEAIEARLRAAGFPLSGAMLPMPPPPPGGRPAGPLAFRRVVVAGAARADKGFHHAVDLVQYIAERNLPPPIALQVSGDHSARHDEPTRAALRRLTAIRCASLTTLPETLDGEAFADLMRGAICLQPYERTEYADKISAITLDALNWAAPIVTVEGTWMAAIVRRYGCGAVAADPQPEALLAAIDAVRADYPAFSLRAAAAARDLAARETWQPLRSRLPQT
jgi:hypothetical protein